VINLSESIKKIILDGLELSVEQEEVEKVIELVDLVRLECKRKQIELWKENFVVNGKVEA
jgi:hypothetical protein